MLTSAHDAATFDKEIKEAQKDLVPVVDVQWLLDTISQGSLFYFALFYLYIFLSSPTYLFDIFFFIFIYIIYILFYCIVCQAMR